MSMWRTDEWLSFEREFGMRRISFDQGCMGHLKRKPTTLGTNIPSLWELDGMRGNGAEGVDQHEEEAFPSDAREVPPDVDPADVADGWEEVELPPPDGPPSLAEQAAQQAYDTWHKLIDEASDVRVQTLTFAELLPSRSTQEILPALARIYCRLRSLGLPVYRLHSDRAREFVASPIRRWCLDRGIIATLTPGSSWKSNGRAEAEVGVLKRGIRTLINAEKRDLDYWPLAARHVAERRLRNQLQRLGWPTGALLAFGTPALAVRKWWQSRYEDWRDVREPVVIMGPDASSSLTHTAYYVKSTDTGHFFYTDDVVTPRHSNAAQRTTEATVYIIV
eukprot:Skav207770  [mRNA]  locus=scaffold2087:161475:163001:+ [translate_table: standard]